MQTAKNITPAEDEVPTTNYNTHENNNQKAVTEKFGTHRTRDNWANRNGLKRKYVKIPKDKKKMSYITKKTHKKQEVIKLKMGCYEKDQGRNVGKRCGN